MLLVVNDPFVFPIWLCLIIDEIHLTSLIQRRSETNSWTQIQWYTSNCCKEYYSYEQGWFQSWTWTLLSISSQLTFIFCERELEWITIILDELEHERDCKLARNNVNLWTWTLLSISSWSTFIFLLTWTWMYYDHFGMNLSSWLEPTLVLMYWPQATSSVCSNRLGVRSIVSY